MNHYNKLHIILFAAFMCFLLWLTNPSDAIKECEKVNKAEFCQILDKE